MKKPRYNPALDTSCLSFEEAVRVAEPFRFRGRVEIRRRTDEDASTPWYGDEPWIVQPERGES